MDYKKTAMDILKNVGGETNVKSTMSCFTRVRVEVRDKTRVDEAMIKKLDGVQGTNWMNNTIQIIMGGHCNATYDELSELLHTEEDSSDTESNKVVEKISVGATIIDYISNSILPIVPILMAAGLIQSILALCGYLNLDTETFVYQVMYSIGQAGYYFLPIFLAYSAANRLKINPYVGALIGAVLVYPTMTSYGLQGGTEHFFGIPVTLVFYASSITPILLSMPIVKQINNFAKKISPKILSTLLVPVITVIISIPVILIITGPIATLISNGLCGIITFIFTKFSVLGGLIIGAFIPYSVLTGIHAGYALPITLTELAANGFSLFFPLLAYGNIAIGGSALGVYLKTKNSKLKQTALSGSLMAVVGITEPALFGVLVPTKKSLISLGIMGAICSAASLIFSVKCTALTICGLGGLPAFFGDTFLIWCVLMIISFVGAAAITYFIGIDDIPE